MMFASVLVANRGEIAVRVIRTLRALGIRSIAVYSDADRDALHVRRADDAVYLGPTPALESYLDVDRVIAAAVSSGAEALHPGYGFLSERVALAERCADAGVVFIGPPVQAIETMGDKINAKRAVAAAGVPVVPGRIESGLDDEALAAAAFEVGLPVLLKPSAGGGGKGMRRVTDPADMRTEIAAARREARGAFGDDTLLVERWVTRPRHIEIQVFADRSGACVHLGERECSLQRRHQKIVEEAPSPLLDGATRAAMGSSAVAAARAVGYVGAGTVEFIVSADRPDEYFFMEMNTRLQVEHPVTEMVTGLDLVELQLRVAAGEGLGFTQEDVALRGHAVEARIYAEDPARGFLPATGTVLALEEPVDRPGVRVDSGLDVGTVVGMAYDPMLAKVVAFGRDRTEALARLDGALGATTILGVTTNIAFLRRLIGQADVRAGRLDTELVERHATALATGPADVDILVAAAMHQILLLEASASADPWDATDGWRVGESAATIFDLQVGPEGHTVAVLGRTHGPSAQPTATVSVHVDGGDPAAVAARVVTGGMEVEVDGRLQRWSTAVDGDVLWLGRGGGAWPVRLRRRHDPAAGAVVSGRGPVTSPMPGTVGSVLVAVGDVVRAGQPLLTVEAMKMEYTVSSTVAGKVTAVHVRPRDQVALDQALALVEPEEGNGQ